MESFSIEDAMFYDDLERQILLIMDEDDEIHIMRDVKDVSRSRRNIRDVIKQRVQGLRRNGSFVGVGDEEVVVGEGVVVTSSSLEMLTNSCLGWIMVSLIFLEGLEEEALVEFMVEWFEEDEDGKKNEKDDSLIIKHRIKVEKHED
nr:hypothetical protein [Tanacetum cinerariifolium]